MKNIHIRANALLLSLVLSSTVCFAHEAEDSSHNTTAHIGFRAGDSRIEGYVDFIVPIWKDTQHHLFFNPRLLLADEGNNQINAGIAYRYLLKDRGVLGANLFYDSRESNRGFRFEQFGAGLEWLGKTFDARVNVYNAQDDLELVDTFQTSETETTQQVSTSQSTAIQTNTFGSATPVATGNSISQSVQTNTTVQTITTQSITTRSVTTDRTFEQFEGALDGWDAEIGYKLPIKAAAEVRLFGGYYAYDNPFNGGDDIRGAKARLQIRSGRYLTFDVEYFEDSFDPSERGSDFFVGARLEVPLTGKTTWKKVLANLWGNPHRSLEDRLHHELIIRDVRIHTDVSDPIEDETQRIETITQSTQTQTSVESETTSSTSTEQIASNVFFVDPENAGAVTGTVENPFQTIAAAVTAAPTNATVFVCEAGGGVCDFNGGGGTHDEVNGVTLAPGQTLTSTIAGVGGGPSLTTQDKPIITSSGQAANTGVINTTSGNTINRLVIETIGSNARHGVFNNASSGTTTINDSHITTNGNNSDAILSTQTTGTVLITNNKLTTNGALNSNTIENNGTTGNVTVSGNTLVSNSQNGDGIENNGSTGNITISNNTFTGTAQNSRGIFNSATTGEVTISDNTLNTTGVNAEGIQNSNTLAPISITNNTITTSNSASQGILNTNISDTVTITGNNITTTGSTGTGILTTTTSSGDIVISDNTIATSDADGIRTNQHSGNITIEDNTISTDGAPNREGILSLNSTGDIAITGNTVTTNGTLAEGIFNSNTAANPTTGTTTVSDNIVITNDTSSDGIVNVGVNDVSVSNNTVTTNGANAEGIRSTRTDGALAISGNTVTTSGTGSEGILSTNITATTLSIENNTVTTNADNSEGIETNPAAANTPVISISGNTVITQGNNSDALNTINVSDTADITSNNLNTNGASAAGSRNRTAAGGTINVSNNTICVPVGENSFDNGAANVTAIGNIVQNQAACP